MKQFSLVDYKPGDQLVTRTGNRVRLVCTDRKNTHCIVGLRETREGEAVESWTAYGVYLFGSHDLDLYFKEHNDS